MLLCFKSDISLFNCVYILFICDLQTAEASDEEEEGKALMIKPGTSSAKEEKDNEAFFKKVEFVLIRILITLQITWSCLKVFA